MRQSFLSTRLQISEDHHLTGWLFIRLLALIYLAAFVSIAVQITGLVGPNGILPFAQQLDFVREQRGWAAFFYTPGLFWISADDMALQAVAWAGALFSLALFFGYQARAMLVLLFICYLSIFHAGQIFLSFQWDSLLLEAGFLSIFLVGGPSRLLVFLFHWLLFRLRFMSGVSKLASGDPSWAGFTTLNYYFETQPLPHAGAWYFHQLPDCILQAGVLLVFFTELVVPFFIFLPRRFRLFAATMTIFMQLLIIASSNHNWINLLTIALCLFLLDDRIVAKILPARLRDRLTSTGPSTVRKTGRASQPDAYLLPVFAAIIVGSSLVAFYQMVSHRQLPDALFRPTVLVRSWGIGHVFHIFPTMQTERQEFQVEGSYDGVNWQAYQLRYKPGPLDKRPEFIVPHQPRLDWMIWFVPPQVPELTGWFDLFLQRLQQGSPEVLALLAYNPFAEKPPRYIRVQVFQYRFTTPEERRKSGNWWQYRYLGLYPYVRPRRP